MRRLHLLMIIVLFFCSPLYAVKVYRLDENHTYATWHVSHFGFSTITGKFFVTGTLVFPDDNDPKKARLNADIDMNSLSTGIATFDTKLKSSEFFNTQQFPRGKLVSQSIQLTGDKEAIVHALLTIKGIKKPIIMTVQLHKEDVHPFYKKRALGFTGETTFKRSDFNVAQYAPSVSDEVIVSIEAEALLNQVL